MVLSDLFATINEITRKYLWKRWRILYDRKLSTWLTNHRSWKNECFFFLKAWHDLLICSQAAQAVTPSAHQWMLLPKHQTGRLELFCNFGCKITQYFWSFRNNLEFPKHSSLNQELSRTHFLTHSDLLNGTLPCVRITLITQQFQNQLLQHKHSHLCPHKPFKTSRSL